MGLEITANFKLNNFPVFLKFGKDILVKFSEVSK